MRHILRTLMLLCLACSLSGSSGLPGLDGDVHTPDYYEQAVRAQFKRGAWERGKLILDEGMKHYGDFSVMNELMGRYYYHHEKWDESRFYLVRSLRDNNENVNARQLLVNVEDKTRNYSSAICYVNELLEVNPYWVGLWLRKIELFRKQGNTVEADRLLRRISQIYPNDVRLRRSYILRLEDHYETSVGKHDKRAASKALEQLIGINPQKESYYRDLSNLYLQQGDQDQALHVLSQGLAALPQSTMLATKRVGILEEQGRYTEALSFVKDRMGTNGALSGLYNYLLMENARVQRDADPYTLYGKVYEKQKTQEALDYLLNTSITRGYNDDAIYYIKEARKRRPDDVSLRWKEYQVQKRMGNTSTANSLMMGLYADRPDDYDVRGEVARIRMEQAVLLMRDGFYSEALPYLRFAQKATTESDVREAAMVRLCTCYAESKRYAEAHRTLDSLHTLYPQRDDYAEKKADLYAAQGKTAAALDLLAGAIRDTTQSVMRALHVAAYEAVAVPYIKRLLEAGATRKAYDETSRMLQLNPSSQDGLHYALTAADLLHHYDDYDRHVRTARSIYPDDAFFLTKQAAIYSREHDYRRALDLLRSALDSLPDDLTLIGAYSQNSELLGLAQLRRSQTREAMATVDSALVYDADNRSLLYTKGMIYEKMHQYDSAYVYQKFYEPSPLEVPEVRQHLKGLMAHSHKHVLGIEYLQGRYGEQDVITSVGTASYSVERERNTYTGTVNYAGRDGGADELTQAQQVPGGQGVQLQAEWRHTFSPRWQGEASASWASRYFPTFSVAVGATRMMRNQWEATARLSYRHINTYKKAFIFDDYIYNEDMGQYGLWRFDHWDKGYKSLITASLGAAKSFNDFRLSLRADGLLLYHSPYFNAVAECKYFPISDGETSISLLGSIGTAPEASLIDNAMPTAFNRLNTMVGLSGRYLLTQHLTLGVLGTWHTFYSQMNGRSGGYDNPQDYLITSYKNLFNISAQVYIRF